MGGRVGCRVDIVVVVFIGLVGCIFGARFVGCEGCCMCSSRSKSAVSIRASGKSGGGVGSG